MKKGCKFAPRYEPIKSTAMKNQSYNGQMPKEFTERIEMLVNTAVNDATVRSITAKMTDAAKVDTIARLILAAI
jgi:hypothetical protein